MSVNTKPKEVTVLVKQTAWLKLRKKNQSQNIKDCKNLKTNSGECHISDTTCESVTASGTHVQLGMKLGNIKLGRSNIQLDWLAEQ